MYSLDTPVAAVKLEDHQLFAHIYNTFDSSACCPVEWDAWCIPRYMPLGE